MTNLIIRNLMDITTHFIVITSRSIVTIMNLIYITIIIIIICFVCKVCEMSVSMPQLYFT